MLIAGKELRLLNKVFRIMLYTLSKVLDIVLNIVVLPYRGQKYFNFALVLQDE